LVNRNCNEGQKNIDPSIKVVDFGQMIPIPANAAVPLHQQVVK
jgi:hypothetical protein